MDRWGKEVGDSGSPDSGTRPEWKGGSPRGRSGRSWGSWDPAPALSPAPWAPSDPLLQHPSPTPKPTDHRREATDRRLRRHSPRSNSSRPSLPLLHPTTEVPRVLLHLETPSLPPSHPRPLPSVLRRRPQSPPEAGQRQGPAAPRARRPTSRLTLGGGTSDAPDPSSSAPLLNDPPPHSSGLSCPRPSPPTSPWGPPGLAAARRQGPSRRVCTSPPPARAGTRSGGAPPRLAAGRGTDAGPRL